MARSSPNKAKPPKRVWRMSDEAPMGVFVEPGAVSTVTVEAVDKPAAEKSSWLESSLDLLFGTEVVEGPDTVPADLFDQLFPQAAEAPSLRPEAKGGEAA